MFYRNLIILCVIATSLSIENFNENEIIVEVKLQHDYPLSKILEELAVSVSGTAALPLCNNTNYEGSSPCLDLSKNCVGLESGLNTRLKRAADASDVDDDDYVEEGSTEDDGKHEGAEASNTQSSASSFENESARKLITPEHQNSSTTAMPNVPAHNATCVVLYFGTNTIEKTTSTPLKNQREEAWVTWCWAFLAVAIISLTGLLGVIFIPIMKKDSFQIVMRFFVGLGVGTLSATAIFQLIPECFELKKHSIEHVQSSTVIWFSIWVFFMFETTCKIVLRFRENRKNKEKLKKLARKNSQSHTSPCDLDEIENDTFLPLARREKVRSYLSADDISAGLALSQPNSSTYNLQNKKPLHHRSHDILATGDTTISSVAWMIIFGDGLHNFIDGVSIGAGFTENWLTGVSISIAIMCEEFPHELGDFAILIKSGMSVKKALIFNFVSACTAFVGLFIGLSIEKLEINTYIFGFAGGLFLYISLADLIPQLNEMVDDALTISTKSACLVLFQETLGVLTGMIILLLLTCYGDSFQLQD